MRKAIIANVGGPMKVIDAALPAVPEDGALVKTLYAGICHSDIQFMDDDFDCGDGEKISYRDTFGDERFLEITLGHEICGVIHEFGKNVDSSSCDLSIGDHVCVALFVGCQKCGACLLGMNNKCEFNQGGATDIGQHPDRSGGYATYVPVPHLRFLIKVPENIPLPVACLLPDAAATSYAGLLKAMPQLTQAIKIHEQANLLIVGVGGLGLWCIKLAKALFPGGNLKITAVDINEEKIKVATESGADRGLIWDRNASVEDLAQMTTMDGEDKIDVVINFVGSVKTVDTALKCLYKGGTLVLIGMYGGTMPLTMVTIITKSITIMGSRGSTLQELRDVVQLISKNGLQYPNLQFFTLAEINQGLSKLREGKIIGRAIVKFE